MTSGHPDGGSSSVSGPRLVYVTESSRHPHRECVRDREPCVAELLVDERDLGP
ncbi:hypothetical protein AAFF_G00170520, partial [Aldrovandia affinis]